MTGIDARNPSAAQDGQNVNPQACASGKPGDEELVERLRRCHAYVVNHEHPDMVPDGMETVTIWTEAADVIERFQADRDALLDKIATAYQIVGALSLATGLIDHPDVQRALDYLSDDDDHAELEPWPKTPFERDAPQAALDAERAARRELVSKRSRKRDLVPGLLRAREIIAAEERNDDPDLALGYHFLSRWAVDMFDFEIRKADEAEGGASIDEATAAAIYAADLILSDLKVVEAERDALQAENDRLREALKEIEAFGPGITHGWAVGVRSIAHAALNKEGA
jgi:hypothetical protein